MGGVAVKAPILELHGRNVAGQRAEEQGQTKGLSTGDGGGFLLPFLAGHKYHLQNAVRRREFA
jgi:hypothetical protein